MTTNSLSAWLLHKQPLGDTSLKTTLYSREQGLISCVYKGGRLPIKQTLLQPFIPLWLSINQRSNSQWNYIQQLEHTARPLILKGTSLFAGLYINELIYYLLDNAESQPTFYTNYEYTLQALANAHERLEMEALLRRFEYRLLEICGYAFSYDQEAYSFEPINVTKRYTFIAGHGFIPAQEGLLGSDIIALGEGQLNDAHHLKIAKYIMRQAINHALEGRKLVSRSLFKVGTK